MHKNAALTIVDKFNYQRSLLDGPALNSITGLLLTELNYKEAIEILTDRFGNKQIIISSHMEALLKLQPVNAMSNVREFELFSIIWKFRLEVYKHWELILHSMELF